MPDDEAAPSAISILVVEDEAPIREGLVDRLQRAGYRVRTAADLAQAHAAIQEPADLVLLDRRLPDGDGLGVLRALREAGKRTAVIVLSARGETEDRIEGLEDGADDYVTKPFHLRELMARIQAVLQRIDSPASADPNPAFGEFALDVAARVLRTGNREVPLTKLEFDLLHYLIRNPHRAVPRSELLDRVWGYDRFPTTRTVDYHVLSLRRKLEPQGSDPRHILTVHGIGYRFEP